MSTEPTPRAPRPGPIESVSWPSQLAAHVIAPTSPPRVHGLDVENDLARHYSFVESVMFGLLGELPSVAAAVTFEVALTFAAPLSVAYASTHAAVLARICSATTSALVGTVGIALGEQARTAATALAPWLEWLQRGTIEAPVPACATSVSREERDAVRRLGAALHARGGMHVAALDLDVSRDAALVAVLHACGLRTSAQIEIALTWARLPFVMAEALAHAPNSYREYPVNLPPIVYGET